MNEIYERRSIRRYKAVSVAQEVIEQILRAGIAAPSSKNRQPWRFIVATGTAKETALLAMEKGLGREKTNPLLPESAEHLPAAWHTLEVMKTAPVVVFIVNPLAKPLSEKMSAEERASDICNAQSVGAAIENMALTATELGLGSLWICDTFFAQKELNRWLSVVGELYAAMAFGIPDENPPARPRYALDSVVEWRS